MAINGTYATTCGISYPTSQTSVPTFSGLATGTFNNTGAGGVGYLSGLNTGGYVTSIAQQNATSAYLNPQSHFTWPNLTGSYTSINFMDAAGFTHVLHVDVAYVPFLMQMGSGAPSVTVLMKNHSPSNKMLDGDFSFDEMEKAELLIEELAGEKAEPRQQEA